KRLSFDVEVLLVIIHLKLLKIRITIQKLLVIRDAVILDPSVGANKTIRQPAHVSLPVTDKKIEVVRSVMSGSKRFTSCRGQQGQLQDREPVNRARLHKYKRLKLRRWL